MAVVWAEGRQSAERLVGHLRADQRGAAKAIGRLQRSFAGMGVPALDFLVTPMSLRIGRMAFSQGLAFFHHELRGRLPMPEGLEPERSVWAEEGTIPVWNEGILTEPKYFSFFQDTPLSPYNPNHRRKWRSHEVLHALGGFFWHPEQTRFEAYLGARLGEILPVVHWYGWDEIFRPTCPKHRGVVLYQEVCEDCEAAAIPFSEVGEEGLEAALESALEAAERASRHGRREWEACWREWETGERVEVEHPRLNSSSDALGYLYGHWPRLTAWSFGAWLERFLIEGVDYYQEIPRYIEAWERVIRGLTGAESPALASDAVVSKRRSRRLLQDVGYRAFLSLESLEEGSRQARQAEGALLPLLEEAAALAFKLHAEAAAIEADASRVCVGGGSEGREEEERGGEGRREGVEGQGRVEVEPKVAEVVGEMIRVWEATWSGFRTIPKESRRAFAALGLVWLPEEGAGGAERRKAESEGLQEGLISVVGEVLQGYEADLALWVEGFRRSEIVRGEGRLLSRFARYLSAAGEGTESLRARLSFEAWLREGKNVDQEAEDFAAIPDDLWQISRGEGRLRLHRTFRRGMWPAEVLEAVLSVPIAESSELAAIHHAGQKRLLLVDPPLRSVIAALEEGRPPKAWLQAGLLPSLSVLLENAFAVWLPRPRGEKARDRLLEGTAL